MISAFYPLLTHRYKMAYPTRSGRSCLATANLPPAEVQEDSGKTLSQLMEQTFSGTIPCDSVCSGRIVKMLLALGDSGRYPHKDFHGHRFAGSKGRLELPLAECCQGCLIHLALHPLEDP